MATTSKTAQREVRKTARVFKEVVEIPDSDGEGSDEEEESLQNELPQSVVGQVEGTTSDDDEDDDEDGEMWETESFFRDALGDSSSPVVFEPRE